MKTKIIPIIFLAMFSFVTAETAIAEAPKTQPAQEALKGVRPFIGSLTAVRMHTMDLKATRTA